MTALYLSPVYLAVNLYLLRWLIRWMGACSHHLKKNWMRGLVISGYLFLALAILIGFLLPAGKPQRFMKLIGNYWLGVLLYAIMTVLVVDLVRILLRHRKKINQERLRSRKTFVMTGGICMLLIAVVSLSGAANARVVRTTDYTVKIHKQVEGIKSMKIVLVADTHLGYNIGSRQMQRMVRKINAEDPDLVVFAGDIFDNEYEALDDPERLIHILKKIRSRYGVYACYGNHDIQEKVLAGFTFHTGKKKVSDPRMDEFLKQADIILLHDEGASVDGKFYLFGRADAERPGRGITRRLTPKQITRDLDQTQPVIVLDHEPRQLEELAAAGADLDLCGHTHDGQMFPGNLTVRLFWENPYGYRKVGRMHNIVTSGVGLFGPNMRVGTKAEICAITVRFD